MQVTIKGGVTKIKLTQAEKRCLKQARDLCESIHRVDGDDGEEGENAAQLLDSIILTYFEDK